MRYAVALSLLMAASGFGQDLVVKDLDGRTASFTPGGDVLVVTFVSVECPVSNAYNDRMSALYNDYKDKGIRFLFVNANRTESAKDIRDHAKSVGLSFPVYKDQNNALADRLGAQVTPESFVMDKTGRLVYHGQMDDSRNEARVQQKTLRQALAAVLAGKPVPKAETKAFGCTIKRVRRAS